MRGSLDVDSDSLRAIELASSKQLHINTTLMKSIHTDEQLNKMKDKLEQIIGPINISDKINDSKLLWTHTSLLESKTLGMIDYIKEKK
jgi:hypothetical protein